MKTKKNYLEFIVIAIVIILATIALYVIYNKVDPQKHQDLLAEIFKILFGSIIVGFIAIVMKYLFDASVSTREKDKITTQRQLDDKYNLMVIKRNDYKRLAELFKDAIKITSDKESQEIPGFLGNYYTGINGNLDNLELIEYDKRIEEIRNSIKDYYDAYIKGNKSLNQDLRKNINGKCNDWYKYFSEKYRNSFQL